MTAVKSNNTHKVYGGSLNVTLADDLKWSHTLTDTADWPEPYMEVMLHLMQKLKLNLIDHRCVVATPADPTLHYLQCT